MKNNSGNRLIDYLRLSKLTIMLPVSLTGFTGYFIFNPHFSIKLILVSFGILLMAISASAFNQIQEFDIDSKMERTTDRPIPAGKIKLTHAIIFSICNLVAGMSIIYSGGNLLAALIGLFTIFWYNGIYTYSKRITAFAVVPGALTGALPPLIGWVAAGGGILDKPILFLEFLFFCRYKKKIFFFNYFYFFSKFFFIWELSALIKSGVDNETYKKYSILLD